MAGTQLGKELRWDEPILTPTGWVKISDIKVGDPVIAGDGSVTQVTGVFPQGIKPLIEIEFDYGQKVIAGHDHLWKILSPSEKFKTKCHSLPRVFGEKRKTIQVPNDKYGEWSVLDTKTMREKYGDEPSFKNRFATPSCGIVQLEKKEAPFDPYVIGVLLGDGSTVKNIRFSSSDEYIVSYVKDVVLAHGGTVNLISRYDYRISFCPKLRDALTSMDCMGKRSWEKSVPHKLLWNSDDIRLAVLQGLMDTDGAVTTDGNVSFTSTSKRLAEDVQFLARSFGAKCHITSRITNYTYNNEKMDGRRSYKVTIRQPSVPLFRLKRKLDRCFIPISTSNHNLIISYRDVEPDEAVCISVAHPDATYVTRDFIVTHNTTSGAMHTAFHLTGRYPDWYIGRRFDEPINMWAGGVTAPTVRDTIQKLLFGDLGQLGTGCVPEEYIIKDSVVNARGVPGAIDRISVKHISGGRSTIAFKNYEQGREKWQSSTLHAIWFDEEPDADLYIEGLARTNATEGVVWMTFTPLQGMSHVVRRFLNEDSPDRSVVNMTIKDVGHYSEEHKKRIIASYPAHEREARAKGIPMLGSGRIFPVTEELITCKPFNIPFTFQRLGGLDFGWDHPTAAVKLAYDPETDVVYVTNVYRVRENTPLFHAAALKAWGDDLSFAWPHDGLQHDKGSGLQLADIYRKNGLKLLGERATFSDGTSGVEAGLMMMLDRFQTGRLKVFDTCTEFFEEFRLYHREEGKVVKEFDDILSALRYALMMLRYAQFLPMDKIRDKIYEKFTGPTRHSVKIEYNPLDPDYIARDQYNPFKS